MSTYKLIKIYPGSPKIIGAEAEQIDKETWRVPNFTFNLRELDKYPEFWQREIKPLFTTNDGVGILDEDSIVWGIYADFSEVFHAPAHLGSAEKWVNGVFSTRESAMKERKNKKLTLSLDDLRNLGADLALLKEAAILITKRVV